MEVVSSISEFRPGDELPRHLHHGVEAGYVVQGAMVQNPGQPPAMLATGAPILNLKPPAGTTDPQQRSKLEFLRALNEWYARGKDDDTELDADAHEATPREATDRRHPALG